MFPREEPVPYIITETHDTVRYTWIRPRNLSQLTIEDLSALDLRGDGTAGDGVHGTSWGMVLWRDSKSKKTDKEPSCVEGCTSGVYARRRPRSESNADMSLVGLLQEKIRKHGRRQSLKKAASSQGLSSEPTAE